MGKAVICFLNQQATRFSRIETFQVDLSFKRVQKEFNELLFAYFDEETGKCSHPLRNTFVLRY